MNGYAMSYIDGRSKAPVAPLTDSERRRMIGAMVVHGGGFVRQLALAWAAADDINSARLEAAFPDYVSRYRKMAATEGEVR